MKKILLFSFLFYQLFIYAQYAPPVGQIGTTAIHKDSSTIINWAAEVIQFNPGLMNIANPTGGNVDFGSTSNALGSAEGTSSDIVSLGDNGSITLGFQHPIRNGLGNDFAVFENGFDNFFLELAHVEVSTDGIRFVRLPSISNTSIATQVNSFGNTDATKIYNLAGKYKQGYGTPFDLSDISDSTNINLDSINFVRVIDVVGSINSNYSTFDSQGNIINDPYPTAFNSGGFDLDGIAVINENTFTGISEKEVELYSVYPNPSKGITTIHTKSDCEVDIVSINGQLVQHYSLLKNEKIEINNLKNGMYLIYFKNNSQNFTHKLIVNQ